MKKKGFTLIELLAVIVVLAIIALIATPIVMNTIKSAKKGAAERSADSYIQSVETAVATAKLDGKDIPDGTYTIDENGNLTGTGLPNGKLEIDMKGNKPTGGTITIKNGQVTNDSKMTVGDYDVAYNEENKKYEATEKGITSLICDLKEGTSQTVGAKYTCHLDNDRTFYVLETSGDNVSLIMSENFTDDTVSATVGWCIDGVRNNTTCKNINSKDEGTPLKHIQDVFGTKVVVSFPTASQLAKASGKTFDNAAISLTPTWLYANLFAFSIPYGYWTASYMSSTSDQAWYVSSDSSVSNITVELSSVFGVRPGITISKSQLN